MSNTIYLYLKTHNVTGLKYLGKTIQDPFKYKGSGKYWGWHIEKHGYDVTTEVLLETTDPEEIIRVGLEYSEKWDIAQSKEFANLMPEQGNGGSRSGRSQPSPSDKTRKKISEKLTGRSLSEETRAKISRYQQNKEVSDATKKKMSEGHQSKRPLVVCPHCSMESHNAGNMNRWHFDNCKHKQAP